MEREVRFTLIGYLDVCKGIAEQHGQRNRRGTKLDGGSGNAKLTSYRPNGQRFRASMRCQPAAKDFIKAFWGKGRPGLRQLRHPVCRPVNAPAFFVYIMHWIKEKHRRQVCK